MKKIYIYMMMIAAMVVAGAAMTSCQKEEAITGKFNMTVKATKGGGNTKALSLDGSTLNATWTVGERVTVHNDTKNADIEGYLEAQSAGSSTTLGGTLTGTVAEGDELTLKFCSPNYSTQDGTLTGNATSIDKVCDYATATVTVTSVGNGKISTGNANFVNQQAIVKFTLLKMADNNALNVTQLVVNDGTNDYTITPASATNVLYVAIPATTTVNLRSPIDGAITYFYEKTGASLVAGQFYNITVKMSREVNLANIDEDITLLNGDKLTGTLGGTHIISIADGAIVTLDGANININNNSKNGSSNCAGITCVGDATINLYGGSIIHCSSNNYPGIQAGPLGKTLTIQGEGSLDAQGGSNAAGIGGGSGITCGNISLMGGAITACGGEGGAGIGGGAGGTCGNIEIEGGNITATGGNGAAGIGSGSGSNAVTACGNIHLYGGIINACGGVGAAGIGSGSGGTCSSIKIEGGTITAEGGDGAAGIGSGSNGSCGNIEIEGGSINATGGEGAGNIGAGAGGSCGTVTQGPLAGLFSVSSTKQVRFSRGNLESDGTFAVNQCNRGANFRSNEWTAPSNDWYVLSADEWSYLYRHSTLGYATVNGIHGLIILPDNYSGSINHPYDSNNTTYTTDPWDDNIYSGDTWATMENNGVVFLPAQNEDADFGYYWSSSDCFQFRCQGTGLFIGSGPWNTSISLNSNQRYACVRLVQNKLIRR